MTRRRNGEGSIYPVKDSHGRVTQSTDEAGTTTAARPTKPLSGHGSSSGTRQAADRSAPTYLSSATSSPTGSKRSSSRTSHPRRTRRMSCSPVCTSIRTLAISGSTSSRSRTLGSGSTSSQASVSAVLRGKTPPGQNPSGDAARSASAAAKSWLRGAVRMPVTRFALLLPAPSRMRSSLVIPWP